MRYNTIIKAFMYSLKKHRDTKKNKRIWSEYEDNALIELTKIFDIEENSIIFNRSIHSIKARIIKKLFIRH